jgi:hypothetical protein
MLAQGSDVWVPAVIGVVGTLLGGVLGVVGERLTSKDNRQARAEERLAAERAVQQQFQLTTVVELQDAMLDYFTIARNLSNIRAGGVDPEGRTESDVHELFIAATNRAEHLRIRLSDETLRTTFKLMLAQGSLLGFSKTAGDTSLHLSKLAELYKQVNTETDRVLKDL